MSFLENLLYELDRLQIILNEMLDNSEVFRSEPRRNPGYIVIGRTYNHWRKKDEANQIKAKRLYNNFKEKFDLLLVHFNPRTLNKVTAADKAILNQVEQNKAPSSITNGKFTVEKNIKIFKDFIELLKSEKTRTVIIPDTNALILFPEPVYYKKLTNEDNFDFVFLPTVLAELDKHKMFHRNEDFRKKAKSIITRIKGYRKQGDVLEGVTVAKIVTVKMVPTEPNFDQNLSWLDPENNDDRIIANILEYQIANPNDKVILITGDINLQNKSQLASLNFYDTDDLG